MNLTERQKGILALILLSICYGTLPLLPRYLSLSLSLFQQMYLRITIAFLLAIFFFRKEISFRKIKKLPYREWLLIIFRVVFYTLLGGTLWTQALLWTKVSNVVLISSIPMTALFGFILFKEKFTIMKFIFICLSFIGAVIISAKSTITISLGRGEIIAFLSVLFFSLGLVSRKWQADILNDKENSTLMLFIAAISLFAISIFSGEGLPIFSWSINQAAILLLAGFLVTAIFYLMNYGFARAPAVLGGIIISLDIIFATFLAFLLFHEFPNMKELFGGFLILISVIFISSFETKED